jgi:hypothetical protein
MQSLAVIPILSVAISSAGLLNVEPDSTQQPPTYAQQLVDHLVAVHSDVKAIELAVGSLDDCTTVAATDRKDVGEKCDDDELGPMRTGEPDVEAPTKDDPVYDITQALHDHTGTLIGAVGMDLAPAPGQDHAAMVARARTLLRELEARIPSKERLLQPAAPAGGND